MLIPAAQSEVDYEITVANAALVVEARNAKLAMMSEVHNNVKA